MEASVSLVEYCGREKHLSIHFRLEGKGEQMKNGSNDDT
jgi:hypothetical protein